MIKVTIELVPHGMAEHSKQIGTLTIANDGTGDSVFSNYNWVAEDDMTGKYSGVTFNHDHDSNVWELIAKCLPSAKMGR